MVYVVNGVLASGVDIILAKDFVCFALQEMKIHPLMLIIRTLSMILQTFSPTLHNPSTNHTRVNYVATMLIMYSIDHQPQIIQEDQQWISDKLIKSHNELFESVRSMFEEFQQREQAANLSTHTPEPSRRFNFIYDEDDDDEESTIPLNEITSQIPPSIAITPVLLTLEPEDSLIMGDEDLSTIPKKESDKFIKSSVEDLVPIPSESEDTSGSDSECDLPSCNDFSLINVSEEKSVTFSNPLFDSNDDFTSSDDESLSDEDVPKDNDIESEDSYVSKLDEPDLLVTPLSKLNEDECFDPGGDFVLEEIEACLTSDSIPPEINDDDFDPERDILLLENLLNDDPSSPLPMKELNCEELKVIKSNVSTDFEDGYYDSEGDIIYLESFKDTILNLPPEDCPDFEDSRARGFVHRSLDLQSFACLYMGI
ncbi:hypothetical protein Tco_0801577 [Tanacetum coccineum]|uniref:Uncharacterized protein n=1 Tax=Tanacetum coccineum TaxID=301880 RepID=A0ABQ4ZWC4_9ASTR